MTARRFRRAASRGSTLRLALLVGLAAALAGCGVRGGDPAQSLAAPEEALRGEAAGYARALAPRPFAFPRDHGPHPEFRTEWWYVTGNLRAADGRRFGFQLTFFQVALAPEAPARGSAFATRHVVMAHFALTDVGAGRFRAAQRLERAAAGLAGARGEPFAVWLDDWRLASVGAGFLPLRVAAAEGDAAIDLVLEEGKPPTPQGDRGLSRKGPGEGNASFYYSMTRLPARGVVRVAGRSFEVRGAAWLDREWSTSALGPDVAGWDWFALQLDDGRDVMFYRLRRKDGADDPLSAGSVVGADGRAARLSAADVSVTPLRFWTSPTTGARYPAAWRFAAPSRGIDVEVRAALDAQELTGLVDYWEGAVDVSGSGRGVGYVEMTGYAARR